MEINTETLIPLLREFIADAVAQGINRAEAEKSKRENLMDIGQACEFLNVTRGTLRKWTREGQIHGFKLNGAKWLYDYTDLCKFIDERKAMSLQYQQDKRTDRHKWREKRAKGEYRTESQKLPFERHHQMECY